MLLQMFDIANDFVSKYSESILINEYGLKYNIEYSKSYVNLKMRSKINQ